MLFASRLIKKVEKMIFITRLTKISRYSLVGLFAAGVHGIVLISLSKILPLSISNLSGFLAGSFVSYLGHSLYTFRNATRGKKFARRWLLIQFTINTVLCTLLPLLLDSINHLNVTAWIFIFTPTLMNILIWSGAAKFSFKRNQAPKCCPLIHTDDLGISNATNKAIFALSRSKAIDSASLLVNGNAVKQAIEEWKKNSTMPLSLHFCLSEGKAINTLNKRKLCNDQGVLNQTFSRLFFVSFLPRELKIRKSIANAIKEELLAQIKRFKELTGLRRLSIDGHQHIHLVPIVLDVILDIAEAEDISWIRTTYEPVPNNISIKNLVNGIIDGGMIKWLILQILSSAAVERIQKKSLKTNAGFSGILFTGKMSYELILAGFNELQTLAILPWQTQPIILIHPAAKMAKNEKIEMLDNFPFSEKFFSSQWRQEELSAITKIKQSKLPFESH